MSSPLAPVRKHRIHARPKYCVQDAWIVLQEPATVVVGLEGGVTQTYQADCWGHPDGQTLRIYLGETLLATYRTGTWPGGCYSFGYRKERPLAVAPTQQEDS